MEEETSIETMRDQAIMEKVIMPMVPLETGKEIDPCIIIALEGKKIEIYLNKIKIYRILNKKNQIEGTLDIFLVDTIKELLKNLSEREEKAEQLNKQEVKNEFEIRKSDRTPNDDRNTRPGRTETGNSFV